MIPTIVLITRSTSNWQGIVDSAVASLGYLEPFFSKEELVTRLPNMDVNLVIIETNPQIGNIHELIITIKEIKEDIFMAALSVGKEEPAPAEG